MCRDGKAKGPSADALVQSNALEPVEIELYRMCIDRDGPRSPESEDEGGSNRSEAGKLPVGRRVTPCEVWA